MLTNVFEYDEINRLTFHIMQSLILCPLAKTAYLATARIFFLLKVSFFRQIFRSKSQKMKISLKLNVLFTIFVQFLAENRIFFSNHTPFT